MNVHHVKVLKLFGHDYWEFDQPKQVEKNKVVLYKKKNDNIDHCDEYLKKKGKIWFYKKNSKIENSEKTEQEDICFVKPKGEPSSLGKNTNDCSSSIIEPTGNEIKSIGKTTSAIGKPTKVKRKLLSDFISVGKETNTNINQKHNNNIREETQNEISNNKNTTESIPIEESIDIEKENIGVPRVKKSKQNKKKRSTSLNEPFNKSFSKSIFSSFSKQRKENSNLEETNQNTNTSETNSTKEKTHSSSRKNGIILDPSKFNFKPTSHSFLKIKKHTQL